MATTVRLARSTSRGSDFELAYASPIILEAKGTDRRSIERHNSKKHRPRSIHDEEGKIGNDGRKRRSQGSSDDEGKLTEDGFSNEDLRVGGPYLCSIPLSTTHIPETNPLSSLFVRKSSNGQDLGTRISSILNNTNIRIYSSWVRGESIELCLRQSEFNPEPHPVPTIVITATRQVIDDTWLQAVRQIYTLLCEENLAHVSVEIDDPQAVDPPHTSPIQPDDEIYRHWDPVLAKILESIELRDILTIGCYRRGRSSETSENAPTVLVMVDVNSRKSWKATRDSIAKILTDFSLPMVAVEIVKDRINLLHRETGFKEEILGAHAIPGGPIAALKKKNASETIGGFIELQDQTEGTWLRFALTCFHVIDLDDRDIVGSQDLAAIKDWRRSGIPIYRYKKSPREFAVLARNMKVSHPSLLAKNEQDNLSHGLIRNIKASSTYQQALTLRDEGFFDELSHHKKERFHLLQQKINKSEANLDRAAKFFEQSQNVLGTVSAGSGFRTIERHTSEDKGYPTEVDWAIISIDRHWSVSNKLDNETGLWELASAKDLRDLETGPDQNRELQFQGYRSGRRQVLYSGLKVAKIRPKSEGETEEPKSLQYSVCGNDSSPPATFGDSGSLLFRSIGQDVVGMIFAGAEINKIAYFTRIDDLREDIMKQTRAKDFRMHNA
ncbi:hypothetical protein N7532_009865 [Penicillium argentinense]|uniref:Uncharacterized protein n=1 Tax=Penicillium argentinense TaxID=1131581 RepID=A0A9W9JX37_9EURO|nr:uncharacterized protein N7532_009865 [Penicillium argentinense]KAJ5085094.1 hypothetical protein N7532_009865 [Penicillium argentinense]